MAQITAPQGLPQIAIGRELRRAARTAGGMRFNFTRMHGIELVVDQRMQHDFCFVAGHGPFSSASHAVRSSPRARARRDITVPTGTPVTSAISR